MPGIWYCTSEQVKDSLEIAHTSRADKLIASSILSASESIESQLRRRFYSEEKTVTFDYPNYSFAPSHRLYLNQNTLISTTSVTSGGVTIDSDDYWLRRSDDIDEPPYTHIDLKLSGSASFSAGDTHQRSISIAGLYGYRDDYGLAGLLVSGINSSVTTVDIAPSDQALDIGIGSIIKIGTEKMIIDARRMLDTTQNTGAILDDLQSATTVAVSDGTEFGIGEILAIDSERLLVEDITGNNLTVRRAYDGTVLAEHSSGADVYALRRCTVRRGVLGSTAASHDAADPVSVFKFPGLINELSVAESIVNLEQKSSAYARVVGTGENQRESVGAGLDALRQQAWIAYGRKGRLRGI